MHEKKSSYSFQKQYFQIIAISTFLGLCYLAIAYLKIKNMALTSGDTAVAEQALWNFIQGNGFYQSFLNAPNNFREHLNFVQYLYVPFYYFFPNLLTLYAVIISTYVGATIFLFHHVRKRISASFAFLISIMFIMNPIVIGQATDTMHVVAVGGPFLLMTLIFYREKRYIPWMFFLLLLGSTSEFVFPTVLMLGALAFLEKRTLRWYLPPLLAGGAMAIAAKLYITIGFGEAGNVLDRFKPENLAENRLGKRFQIFESMLRPFAYILPFFSLAAVILIPTFLLVFVIISPGRLSSYSHLLCLAPPILIMATVDLLEKCNAKWKSRLLAVAILATLASIPSWIGIIKIKSPENLAQMKEAIELIPDQGSVTSSRAVGYYLNHRKEFFLANNSQKTDYVVFNTNVKEDNGTYLTFIEKSGEYHKIYDKNKVVVYIKNEKLNGLLGSGFTHKSNDEIISQLKEIRKNNYR